MYELGIFRSFLFPVIYVHGPVYLVQFSVLSKLKNNAAFATVVNQLLFIFL